MKTLPDHIKGNSLMIGQIKSQNVWDGYNQVALLQWIVAQGTRRGQNASNSPHTLIGDEAASLVYPLPFAHLLRFVVE